MFMDIARQEGRSLVAICTSEWSRFQQRLDYIKSPFIAQRVLGPPQLKPDVPGPGAAGPNTVAPAIPATPTATLEPPATPEPPTYVDGTAKGGAPIVGKKKPLTESAACGIAVNVFRPNDGLCAGLPYRQQCYLNVVVSQKYDIATAPSTVFCRARAKEKKRAAARVACHAFGIGHTPQMATFKLRPLPYRVQFGRISENTCRGA